MLARELGIEPRTTESKSVVLPLHHSRTDLVRPERFELPTPTFVALYSIQMNYGRKLGLIVHCTIRKAGVCRLHTTCLIVLRMQGRDL